MVGSKNSGNGQCQREALGGREVSARRLAVGRCPPGSDDAVRILLALSGV